MKGLALLAVVVVVSAATATAVALSTGSSSVLDTVTRVTVTLVIPASIVIAFWVATRRAVRKRLPDSEAQAVADLAAIARVSHAIRDRLTVIYGFSETLLDSGLSDPTEVRDVLTVINSESVDVGRMMDDLVTASDSTMVASRPRSVRFDPAAEVERVVHPFRRRGYSIDIDCWSGVAISDDTLFRHILRSLISNAIEHGGTTIAVIGEFVDDTFHCSVADDGAGFDPEVATRLFRSDRAPTPRVTDFGVSGLGLPVAMANAAALGGRMSLGETEDLTVVTLTLPTEAWPDVPTNIPPADGSESEAADDASTEEPSAHPPGDNWTISFDGAATQPSSTEPSPLDAPVPP